MTGLMISMHTQFSDKYICWDNKVKKKRKREKILWMLKLRNHLTESRWGII